MLMSETAKQKIIRWYARQPEAIRIEIFKKQRDIFFEMRKFEKEKPEQSRKTPHELTYESFLQAIYLVWKTEFVGGTKETNHKTETIKQKIIERIKRHKINIKKPRRQKKLRDLEKFDRDIRVMREEGLSYQKIADYFAKYHKTKIHFTYIQKYMKEHP